MRGRIVAGELDIDLERRTARGEASGSLKGRHFRDLGSLSGVRGGQLGGSESWLEEAMASVPLRRGEGEKAFGSRRCEQSRLKKVSYTRVSRNGVVCRRDEICQCMRTDNLNTDPPSHVGLSCSGPTTDDPPHAKFPTMHRA